MAENLVNSLVKALKALDILAFEDVEKKGAALSLLSKRTGVPANTLHNLLKTLVKCGYAAQKDDSSYIAGPKCDEMGRKNLWHGLVQSRLLPVVRQCAADTGESVVLCALLDGGRIPLLNIDSSQAVGVDSSKIADVNFYSLVTGRVLAAFAEEDAFDRIFAKWGLPGKNWDGLDDKKSFFAALESVRKNGLARDVLSNGVLAMALPVFAPSGRLFGALGCHLPHFRCDSACEKEILSRLDSCRRELSASL